MNQRIKEAIRYLGYGRHEIDEPTLALIQESFQELEQIAEKKFVYRMFELKNDLDENLMIGSLNVKSHSLSLNLKQCKKAIIFAATLGAEVDRQLRKYEVVNLTKAVVLQACAAAYLEEYCDCMQGDLLKNLGDEWAFKPRFSPGYGDFSISHQDDILKMIEASKRIGLSLTEGKMLTPSKSITAVIGVYSTKE